MVQLPHNLASSILAELKGANSILVTSHKDCDGDSVGSQLAISDYLISLGKKVTCAQHGPIPPTLSFLPNLERIIDVCESGLGNGVAFDLALVLECPDLSRTGDVEQYVMNSERVINIDHHGDNTDYGDISWVDPQASSVAEMVALIFERDNYDFSKDTATALYTAIMTDTGRFHYQSAGSTTFEVVSSLLRKGIDIQWICDNVYYRRRPQSLKLAGLALSAIEFLADERICLLQVTDEMITEAKAENGDTEGLVEYTLYGEKAEIGALLRQNGADGVKVSLRSRGDWDMAKVAGQFGGGGHKNAAGCWLDSSLSDATDKITIELVKLIDA